MRLFLGLLCGAASLALASGCGTARAIVNDRDPDAYVESIRPTSGVSGDSAAFEAVCCFKPGQNKENLRYEWNFGGACDPNVSYDEIPIVHFRAGSAAPYNASLKLTGGCLGENLSLTTPFQINVAPLSVVTVTGTTGISKGNGSFSAVIGSGVVEKYSWDFGGAASPSGATAENPTVNFVTVAVPTVFQGRLVVSNKYEVTEFLFDITVNP
jgi:hypothetical protein